MHLTHKQPYAMTDAERLGLDFYSRDRRCHRAVVDAAQKARALRNAECGRRLRKLFRMDR